MIVLVVAPALTEAWVCISGVPVCVYGRLLVLREGVKQGCIEMYRFQYVSCGTKTFQLCAFHIKQT